MKKINKKILILLVFLVIGLSSCEDYLDQTPNGVILDEKAIYDKKSTLLEVLASCYSYMPNLLLNYGDDSYMEGAPGACVGWAVLSSELDCKKPEYWTNSVQQGSFNPSSRYKNDLWTWYYKGIRVINTFLENVHLISGFTQNDIDNMKMEARFLRAYYYTLLLEQYGPVPLVKVAVPLEATSYPARATYDEAVKYITDELTEVAEKLPVKNNSATWDYGKPTKGAALAVKARLLLYAASPLYNGNTDYVKFKNNDGTNLINQTYDNEKWLKAANSTKELLDMVDLGIYDLHKEYNDDGTIDPYMSLKNIFFKFEGNKELLFVETRTTISDRDKWLTNYGLMTACKHINGFSLLAPTQESVDAFYTKNGLDIKEDNAYSETGYTYGKVFSPIKTQWSDNGPNGQLTGDTTFNMYVNREPRFYLSISWCGSICAFDKENIDMRYGKGDELKDMNGSVTGYLMRKNTDSGYNPWDANHVTKYRPIVLYRLAEFYLNYAEALNEYYGSVKSTEILESINKVRERAGIPLITSYTDKDKMRALIFRERQNEFFGECGIRYFDIIRTKQGEALLNGDFHGMNVVASTYNTFFQRTVYESHVFPKKYYFFPIAQWEIEKNRSLVQNPGW